MSCIDGPRFAQFVRSNVCIKKKSNTEYTLTLCKLAPITLYQIVSRINPDLDNKRDSTLTAGSEVKTIIISKLSLPKIDNFFMVSFGFFNRIIKADLPGLLVVVSKTS